MRQSSPIERTRAVIALPVSFSDSQATRGTCIAWLVYCPRM